MINGLNVSWKVGCYILYIKFLEFFLFYILKAPLDVRFKRKVNWR